MSTVDTVFLRLRLVDALRLPMLGDVKHLQIYSHQMQGQS